jgi:hypothetical protein
MSDGGVLNRLFNGRFGPWLCRGTPVVSRYMAVFVDGRDRRGFEGEFHVPPIAARLARVPWPRVVRRDLSAGMRVAVVEALVERDPALEGAEWTCSVLLDVNGPGRVL